MDPAHLEGLKKMDVPKTAEELPQFIYCFHRISSSTPDFASRISPLNDILMAAYKKSGKRTKRSIKSIALSSLSWGPIHEQMFQSLQESLPNAVILSYRDPEKEICVFTDASESFWSGVVSETDKEQLKRSLAEQSHEPLAFLGGEFKEAEFGWSPFKKEGFAN